MISARRLPDIPLGDEDWRRYHIDMRRELETWRSELLQIGRLLNRPSFSVHRNGVTQGITTGTPVKVQWTTAEHDSHDYFDRATNYRYTPKVAGSFMFHTQSRWVDAMGAGQFRSLHIYKNGSSVRHAVVSPAGGDTEGSTVTCAALLRMNGTTDYVEVFVGHDHGSDRDLSGAAAATFFHGYRVSD